MGSGKGRSNKSRFRKQRRDDARVEEMARTGNESNELQVAEFTSLSELDDPRGADAMQKMLEGYAIAEIVTLAIMADGELTHAELSALREVTGAQDIGVIIEAQHLCMMMRGVEKQNSKMKTSAMLGAFEQNPATRSEFLNLLGR